MSRHIRKTEKKGCILESEYNTDIIAFDFFDTIVHRNCDPEKVLYDWAKVSARFLKYSISASELYQIRKCEEKLGKKLLKKEELTYKELLCRIYSTLDTKKVINVPFDEFYNFSLKQEIEIEKSHIFLAENILMELAKLYKKGKKIIVISDFYIGRELFDEILRCFGLQTYISEIFISSDYGARKSTGNLYSLILNKLQIKPQELSMTGDNKQSDYTIPLSMGINAYWRPYSDSNQKCNDYKTLIQRCKYNSFSDPENSPFSGSNFDILFFISKLYKELIAANAKCVFFCSREGQLLKKMFDLYQGKFYGDKKIQTHYLYVSRRSTLLPSLGDLDNEKFENIFRQYKKLSLNDFLSSINYSLEEISEITSELGIKSTDIITADKNDITMKSLKSSCIFRNIYNKRRLEQKKLFINYIESFDTIEDTIYLIDIGWKGTIQDNISQILQNKYIVKGYYLGLMTEDYKVDNLGLKGGILFSDNPRKCANYYLLQRGYMFYERIFVANHGPVIAYNWENEKVVPVFNNDKNELILFSYVNEFQKEMINNYKQMLDDFDNSRWLPYELYEIMIKFSLWKQCVHLPKIWRIEKNARDKSRENFGDISKNSLVKRTKMGAEQFTKKDYFFVDYAYRLLEHAHLFFLSPIAALYCRLVYLAKRLMLESKPDHDIK